MTLTIEKSEIFGSVYIQISKSDAHRALIASSLSNGVSILKHWMDNVSLDINATLNAMSNFSDFEYSDKENTLKIIPKNNKDIIKDLTINVEESGTSLRLLVPIMSALGINTTFIGGEKLFSRPMSVYKDIFDKQGLLFDLQKSSLRIEGRLKPDEFHISGDISSQFFSGLLFSLPLLNGDSKIIVDTILESRSYVMMTLKTLKESKIEVSKHNDNFIEVFGNQNYAPLSYTIESDWSHCAFFAVSAALAGEVTLYGLDKYSIQADKYILNVLKYIGASITYNDDSSITIKKQGKINSLDIDISNIVDLAPILVVIGATASDGTTKLYNAHRLKYKESDRIKDLEDSFRRIGVKIRTTDDEIFIEGNGGIKGGKTTSHNDHRIAMALSVAGLISDEPIIIDDAESISKSSFSFINDFKSIGAKVSIS